MAHLRRLPLLAFAVSALAVGCGASHSPDDGGPDLGLALDCACGVDAALVDAGTDAPPPLDAGPDAPPPSSCAADDATAVVCPTAVCDGLDSYAWDGERCIRIDCGACTGTACSTLEHSEDACRARHATCVPELCRATGGDWLFFAEECHHYHCGHALPAECLIGTPVCDCGSGRSFVDGLGCVLDPTCPAVDPLPPDALCAATGGTWTPGICCATRCGQLCPADCIAPACACGPTQVFDGERGCIEASECHVLASGGLCNAGAVRCADGLLCCQHCGGAGCSPDQTCQAPVCDSDPTIDECGNNLLAP